MNNKLQDKSTLRTILLLFFISGITALVYQTLWVRICGRIFGVTVFAVSCVLTAFMTGLASGSFYFGKLVDKRKNPLIIWALLELGIGIYALIFPLLIQAVNSIHIAVYRAFHPGFVSLTALRFFLSFIIMIIPAALMGGTLPVLSKFTVKRLKEIGWNVGSLYSVNSLGAVIGTFITAFFLIHILGIKLSLFITALVNLLLAYAAYRLAKSAGPEPAGLDSPEAGASGRTVQGGLLWLVLSVFFIEGFAALALEVIWSRVFIFHFGNSIYSFTIVAATFIAGISLGGYISSRYADRIKDKLLVFGLIEVLVGITCFLASLLISWKVPGLFHMLSGITRMGWWGYTSVRIIISLLIMIIPTTLMGLTFPIVCRIYTSSLRKTGSQVGNAYGINTAGSILGSFAGGFILIPLFGIRPGITFMAILIMLAGGMVLLFHPGKKPAFKAATSMFLIIMTLVFLVVKLPDHYVRHNRYRNFELLFYQEGISGTVTVTRDRDRRKELSINGTSLATNMYNHRQLFHMLAHLPALLHPEPESALVIGLGGGMTLGSLEQHSTLKHIDCVELSPEMKNGTRQFSYENKNALEDKRLNLINEDGKNYMLITDRKYDVITSDPIHPVIAGNSSLYSKEYFDLCSRRLTPAGVACQWLPFHSVSEKHYKMIIRSFLEAFPHTSLWYAGAYTLLIGTPEELSIDFAQLKKRLASLLIKKDLLEFGLDNPLTFVNNFVMAGKDLKEYVGDVKPNDDDHAEVEFLGPRRVKLNESPGISSFRYHRKPVLPYLTNITENVKKAFPVYFESKKYSLRGQIARFLREPPEIEREAYRKAIEMNPLDVNTKNLLRILKGEIRNFRK